MSKLSNYIQSTSVIISVIGAISLIVFASFIYTKANGLVVKQSDIGQVFTQANPSTPPKQAFTNQSELQQVVDEWVAAQNGQFGIVVQVITPGGNGARAEHNAKRQFVAASTYKLFLSYLLLEQVDAMQFNLDTQTEIGLNLRSCFESLIVYSWDVCAYPMGTLIGWPKLQQQLLQAGFTNTDINNYNATGDFTSDKFTTAEDASQLMQRLAHGKLLSPESSNYLLNLLKQQQWRERIPAGVPAGIEVADKPGWLYNFENDVALVYGQDVTYILSIFSENSSPEELAELSQLVYEFFHPN